MTEYKIEVEREISRRSQRLPQPGDYWIGKLGINPFRPENILLFQRNHSEQLSLTPNQHHRYLLIVSLAGAGSVGVDSRLCSMKTGQAMVVFPFQTHFYSNFLAHEISWLFISFEQSRHFELESLKDRGCLSLTSEALFHLRNLLRAWQLPSQEDTLPLHLGLLMHLMVSLGKLKSQGKLPARKASNLPSDLVERVNRIVFQNRHRPLSIDQMASALGHSVSFLRKRFQEATGRSIGRHAREVRLNHACELLHSSSLSIEEISMRCGYDSLFAFSRAFQHFFGRSPRRYRNERFESGVGRESHGFSVV